MQQDEKSVTDFSLKICILHSLASLTSGPILTLIIVLLVFRLYPRTHTGTHTHTRTGPQTHTTHLHVSDIQIVIMIVATLLTTLWTSLTINHKIKVIVVVGDVVAKIDDMQ